MFGGGGGGRGEGIWGGGDELAAYVGSVWPSVSTHLELGLRSF